MFVEALKLKVLNVAACRGKSFGTSDQSSGFMLSLVTCFYFPCFIIFNFQR